MQQGGFVKGSHVENPPLASLPSHTQQSNKVPTCSDQLFSSIPHTALHRPLFHVHATTIMSFLQLLLFLHISSRSNFEGAVGLEDVQVIFGDIAVDAAELKETKRRGGGRTGHRDRDDEQEARPRVCRFVDVQCHEHPTQFPYVKWCGSFASVLLVTSALRSVLRTIRFRFFSIFLIADVFMEFLTFRKVHRFCRFPVSCTRDFHNKLEDMRQHISVGVLFCFCIMSVLVILVSTPVCQRGTALSANPCVSGR